MGQVVELDVVARERAAAVRRQRPVALRVVVFTCVLMGRGVLGLFKFSFGLARIVLGILLVLFEPIMSLLVPLAFGCFMVTLLFGFVLASPGFPKWGMLTFSVGCMLLYMVYVAFMFWVLPWRR